MNKVVIVKSKKATLLVNKQGRVSLTNYSEQEERVIEELVSFGFSPLEATKLMFYRHQYEQGN